MQLVSDPERAVAVIDSGHRIYLHEASMTPHTLLAGLASRARNLHGLETVSLHTEGDAPHVAPELSSHLRHNALFVGANVRRAVQEGRADFTPVFLSEVPSLFRDGTLPLDVALVQVSPPNKHGYCTLGLSVATARSAVDHAKVVIAEINHRVPRTAGHSAVHESKIDFAIEIERPLPIHEDLEPGPIESAIGNRVAELVPDGATLQLGIGGIPDAVLSALGGRSDLGVHTEMCSNGLVRLVRSGAVTGRCKSRFHGRVITSFAMGNDELHRYCDDNAGIEFHPSDVVNDHTEIAAQHAMISINSAISIDLTGQVCADSMGDRIWSGIGGQMDFVRGAVLSPSGKAIIALPATARKGTLSRIVPRLEAGSGVVTTRGHVQWVVTEFGAVNLRGRTLKERAEMLISIAAPEFRAELRAAASQRRLIA